MTRAIIEGARKFDAVAAFEAFYKLADGRRRTQAAWADFDVMVVPTIPRPYTVAEVEADPVRLNSRLGTYTNFVNLLDLSAFATPSGMRGDGLPSSLTLIGPSGADGLLAGVAAAIQSRSGAPMGATGLAVPPIAPAPARAPSGRVAIAVVGAHLAGLPLNHELVELGGAFLREAETTSDYRLFALPGSQPPKPGLLRAPDGAGAAIRLELWTLDPAGFGAFVAKIPAPLGIGTIRLSDGSSAKGFLVEAEAVKGAEDISRFGGWRAYLESDQAMTGSSFRRCGRAGARNCVAALRVVGARGQAIALAFVEKDAVRPGDAEFQAFCDAPGAFDDMSSRVRGAFSAHRLFERLEPPIEMPRVDRQRQAPLDRLAMIAARHHGDRGPERAHPLEMRAPVGDALIEKRAEDGVGAHALVERVDEALHHRVVDAGPPSDIRSRHGDTGFATDADEVPKLDEILRFAPGRRPIRRKSTEEKDTLQFTWRRFVRSSCMPMSSDKSG